MQSKKELNAIHKTVLTEETFLGFIEQYKNKNIISIEVFKEKNIQEVHVYYTQKEKEPTLGPFDYFYDVIIMDGDDAMISNVTHLVNNGRLTEVAVYKTDMVNRKHFGFYFTNNGLACHFQKNFRSSDHQIEVV